MTTKSMGFPKVWKTEDTMTVGAAEVEEWLQANPEWSHDYFLRKAEVTLINKWLMRHGFDTLQDYISVRRGSLAQPPLHLPHHDDTGSGNTSPDLRHTGHDTFRTESPEPLGVPRHTRSNSKKYLRHDFARARMRSMFRTCESPTNSEAALAERRSSLKGMRQFHSLPSSSSSILSMLIQSKVRLPRYTSIDEELKAQLRKCNERDFFLEIIKDISHDLDLKTLTGRIIVNICILLSADRSSLFFVEGSKGEKVLVSKVFDVYTGTNCIPVVRGDNIVKIPWGEGIIGHVAATGETVNLMNAGQDPRYNDNVDVIGGYTTDSLLCMPIKNAEEEIIGVAQVVNKKQESGMSFCIEDLGFSRDDEKNLEMYLTFCGMAVSNAQAIESYSREYDRNKALLEVAHALFEEQTSLDDVVRKIMQRAKTLLKCERCIVMLKEPRDMTPQRENRFSRVFDLHQSGKNGHVAQGEPICIKSFSAESCSDMWLPYQIARIALSTGEMVNVADVQADHRFHNTNFGETNFQAKSILCKPIRNNQLQTIGVAQLINKSDGSEFDEHDEQLFGAFAIFCGLGIHNCMLYDELARSVAKQNVALEVLSYHATTTIDDVLSFKCNYYLQIEEAIEAAETRHMIGAKMWDIGCLEFDDFSLNCDEMIVAAINIFTQMGFLKRLRINQETLIRWLLTTKKNYRNIAYHNWRHAFNVCQFMYTLLHTCNMGQHLSDMESLALIVACLCHDLDHRGTNNAFQQKSSSPIAQLYGTQATLEHHHFNHAVMILNSEGHNIFVNLESTDFSHVMQLLKEAILATDLSLHMKMRERFDPLIDSGEYDWRIPEHRETLRHVLMTTCDIAAITKKWDVQRRVADLVVTEFFEQGDKEKAMLNIQPQALMDRNKRDELPKLQMEWIDGICMPLFKTLVKIDETFTILVERIEENRNEWRTLNEQRLAKHNNRQTDV